MRRRRFPVRSLFAASLAFSGTVSEAAAGGAVSERVASYAIAGTTGADLYASIGEKGPLVDGRGRTIAHTTYTLTWRRDYRREAGSCVLAAAVPNLVITYTLPKPAAALSGPVKASWDRFFAGIRAHEENHGRFVREAVSEIEMATVGLSIAGDRDCTKVRAAVQKRLVPIAQSLRQRNRDFDRVEMGEGGNVQALVLSLVNGP